MLSNESSVFCAHYAHRFTPLFYLKLYPHQLRGEVIIEIRCEWLPQAKRPVQTIYAFCKRASSFDVKWRFRYTASLQDSGYWNVRSIRRVVLPSSGCSLPLTAVACVLFNPKCIASMFSVKIADHCLANWSSFSFSGKPQVVRSSKILEKLREGFSKITQVRQLMTSGLKKIDPVLDPTLYLNLAPWTKWTELSNFF